MALDKITKVSGRGVYVPGNDIDTDRIIPARFMKCVTFDGLGEHAFHDVRFKDDEGTEPTEHPLNEERFSGASVLLSNANFGCGSSREHAPQALAKAGFRAVVAENFAEIFFGNSTTLGIPCVSVSHDDVVRLAEEIDKEPTTEIKIDLTAKTVTAGSVVAPLSIKDAAREALREGQWDPIGQLLEARDRVEQVARELPYLGFGS